MSDTSIPIRDAALQARNRAVRDDAGVITPYNLEAPDQRAALLAAFVGLATSAAQATGNGLLADIKALLTSEGGYLDGVEGLLGTSNGSLAAIVTALAGTLAVKQSGAAYTETTVTLTTAQIAGIDPLLPANPNRRALVFGGAARDFRISRNAGSVTGLPVYGSSRDAIEAPVPIGALYLATGSGFAVGNTITVWEA